MAARSPVGRRQGLLVVAGVFSAVLRLKGLRLPKGFLDGGVTGLYLVVE
ncbi:hypothetical protein [Hymenobacter volaticus]|uniref:Uncharacterized protein n=1 Tax=Hymenobacter volaticus TaxID=2932254 RepID=A0ABY4GDV2_9BACT|nr:hypothetical protein [Hymenobacter volaticus]UOQ69029.1 hypothetical protein MUN86_26360 [Hymenobacter volaticus]